MRFNGGIYGELFLGASYVKVEPRRARRRHTPGGPRRGRQAMMDNFLGRGAGDPTNSDHGTARSKNILFQYDYSFGTLARYPEAFWGNGADLKLQLFSLYTHVSSADPNWDSQDKLKFGGKIIYSPLSWFAGMVRFDRVIPNMSPDSTLIPCCRNAGRLLGRTSACYRRGSRSAPRSWRTRRRHPVLEVLLPVERARGVPADARQDLIYANPTPGVQPFDGDVFSIAGTMWL